MMQVQQAGCIQLDEALALEVNVRLSTAVTPLLNVDLIALFIIFPPS